MNLIHSAICKKLGKWLEYRFKVIGEGGEKGKGPPAIMCCEMNMETIASFVLFTRRKVIEAIEGLFTRNEVLTNVKISYY